MNQETFRVKTGGDLHTSRHVTGAGFVVMRKFGDEYKVLCLAQQGKFDLPKGHIERNETSIEAAFRELEEEASITRITFNWGLEHIVLSEQLIMYAGVTNQDGEVKRNPTTGIYEHEKVMWLTFKEAEQFVLPYLKHAVLWAKSKLYESTGDERYKVDLYARIK